MVREQRRDNSQAVEEGIPMKQITIKNFHSYEVQKHREGDGKDIQIWGLKEMEVQSDEIESRVLPSEAIYGFAGWLSARDESITIGATFDASAVAEAVGEYCRVQGYEDPRDSHYPNNIVRMPTKRL